jgi:hypothetical protein
LTTNPAFIKFFTIPWPMMPRPMKPILSLMSVPQITLH